MKYLHRIPLAMSAIIFGWSVWYWCSSESVAVVTLPIAQCYIESAYQVSGMNADHSNLDSLYHTLPQRRIQSRKEMDRRKVDNAQRVRILSILDILMQWP